MLRNYFLTQASSWLFKLHFKQRLNAHFVPWSNDLILAFWKTVAIYGNESANVNLKDRNLTQIYTLSALNTYPMTFSRIKLTGRKRKKLWVVLQINFTSSWFLLMRFLPVIDLIVSEDTVCPSRSYWTKLEDSSGTSTDFSGPFVQV